MASGSQYAAIVLGQDMTLGYNGPTPKNPKFSVSESLALLIREPKAISSSDRYHYQESIRLSLFLYFSFLKENYTQN